MSYIYEYTFHPAVIANFLYHYLLGVPYSSGFRVVYHLVVSSLCVSSYFCK